MYILELLLKGNPAAIVVHQKEEEAANQAYQSVVNALKKGSPESLELTCDRTGKKVFVLTSELCGVQMTSKSVFWPRWKAEHGSCLLCREGCQCLRWRFG
jgi:hypothetical protein